MNINPLLKEKWETQARLAQAANYDIKQMMQNGRILLERAEVELGAKFVVAKRKPLKPNLPSRHTAS